MKKHQQIGLDAERRFARLLHQAGVRYVASTVEQDLYQMIDFWVWNHHGTPVPVQFTVALRPEILARKTAALAGTPIVLFRIQYARLQGGSPAEIIAELYDLIDSADTQQTEEAIAALPPYERALHQLARAVTVAPDGDDPAVRQAMAAAAEAGVAPRAASTIARWPLTKAQRFMHAHLGRKAVEEGRFDPTLHPDLDENQRRLAEAAFAAVLAVDQRGLPGNPRRDPAVVELTRALLAANEAGIAISELSRITGIREASISKRLKTARARTP